VCVCVCVAHPLRQQRSLTAKLPTTNTNVKRLSHKKDQAD